MAPSHALRRRRAFPVVPVLGLVVGIVVAGVTSTQIAQAAPSVTASDAFSRTVSSGWGSATKGGAYTVVADKATKLSVSSGRGHVRDLAKTRAVTATLKSVTAADVEMQGTMAMPGKAPIVYHAYQLRTQSNGSLYRGRIDVLAGGAVDLTVSRLDPGNKEVTLARKRMSFTAGTNTAITSDFQVTGTSPVTIKARAWLAASSEPSWQLTTTDSSAQRITAAGHVGLWEYSSGSNKAAIGTDEDTIMVTSNPTAAVVAPTPPVTSPPVTVPPPATSPTSGDRGSLPVGSSDYAIPAGALFVSPSGHDTAAGSAAAPLQTLGAAIAKATPGSTIVLRAGVYNESVVIPESKPHLTIQAYPHESVWLDGSVPVTNWTKTGSTWTSSGWNHFFADTLDGIANNPYFVDTAHYPLAAQADMVFSDGAQLTQVSAPSAVVPGTFAVDQAAHTITVGSDPSGHDLRASNQMQAIYAKSVGTTLEGFGVRRYATPYNVRGALRLGGVGETARNIVIEDSATTGMNFEADDITLDHLTVTRSGMQGLGGNSTYGTTLENSVVSYANDEHFNESPVSGGVKITRSRDLVVKNNDFVDNYSFGLWLDESCLDPHITDNTFSGNSGHGVEVEISAGAIIADNTATSNGKSGIRLLDTSDSQIYNNSIGGNGVFGIQLSQDSRREADLSVPGHDPRQPEPDPDFTWLTQNDTVANNAFGTGGQFQVYALDNWTNIPVDNWHLTITGNLFNSQPSSSQPTMVAWGGSNNVTLDRFSTPGALASAKGPSWKNAQTTSVEPLGSMSSAMAQAVSTAVPLPADVAAAVGQPTGTKHVGTF